jgi:hypothetical protein
LDTIAVVTIALHPFGFAVYECIQQLFSQTHVRISTIEYQALLSDSESSAQALKHNPAPPTPRQRIGSAY